MGVLLPYIVGWWGGPISWEAKPVLDSLTPRDCLVVCFDTSLVILTTFFIYTFLDFLDARLEFLELCAIKTLTLRQKVSFVTLAACEYDEHMF